MNIALCLLAILAIIGTFTSIIIAFCTKKRAPYAMMLVFALYLLWFYAPIKDLKARYQLERVASINQIDEIKTMNVEEATEIAFSVLSECKWQRSAWSSIFSNREFKSGACMSIYLCSSNEVAYSDCNILRLNEKNELDRFIDYQGIVYFPLEDRK